MDSSCENRPRVGCSAQSLAMLSAGHEVMIGVVQVCRKGFTIVPLRCPEDDCPAMIVVSWVEWITLDSRCVQVCERRRPVGDLGVASIQRTRHLPVAYLSPSRATHRVTNDQYPAAEHHRPNGGMKFRGLGEWIAVLISPPTSHG